MRPFLRFLAGAMCGLVLALWIPVLFQTPEMWIPIKPPGTHGKAMEGSPDSGPQPNEREPKAMPLKVTVAETLRTGDPTDSTEAMPKISGNLPKNLRFRWMDDPASGLAPAFLWEKKNAFILGRKKIAPQDGDIRAAYAFKAPAVLPDQYAGRLIFHKRVLARLLEWTRTLPEDAVNEELPIQVSKPEDGKVGFRLPPTSKTPSLYLTVSL